MTVEDNGGWIKFSDEYRVRFLNLIRRLNRDLFQRLSDFEKSYFYHYWQHAFNLNDCWLLELDGKDVGFVSRPVWKPNHWMRWPENILLLSPSLKLLPKLPEEISQEKYFRTGLIGEGSSLLFSSATILQTASAANLHHFTPLSSDYINSDVAYCLLEDKHLHQIQSIISVPENSAEAYYGNENKRMIEENSKHKYGLGYYARSKASQLPVAVVFYEAFEMPLTGTPCMLISDIHVKDDYRRKHIASSLQNFAYLDMKSRGINWVLGNIEVDNEASRKQAQKLGRIPWAQQIRLN